MLGRDLPQLAAANADVRVGTGVSIALLDRELQSHLEPGTPSPRARLDLVRRITDAGLPCGVMVAPVLPWLTDSTEALDALLGEIAAAGGEPGHGPRAAPAPGTREWFLAWLGRTHPALLPRYARLYRGGAYAAPDYRRALARRVSPLLARHGLDRPEPNPRDPGWTRQPVRAGAAAGPDAGQLSLL
ncbi:hypothetical protein [Pseudonocardia sp. ICBG601]|uniref:SPL family radical SAM protein n=1 Tax=Pseudonocardia sp. ICBG601 TaxID=2846759 RepID=UPI001CF62256|nr:hypothetical protein [Pseudonocardia sp. ICBG601]